MRIVASVCRDLVVGFVACVAVAGCSGASSMALSKPVIDTLAGGTVRVHNSGPSEWTDTNGWKLALERTSHPPAGSPGELVHPSGAVASSNGDVFVLDSKPAVIKHYSSDGSFLGTIGREGSGPGEFRDYGVLYIARDTLVHQDAGQARLSVFGTDGAFIKSSTSSPITERGLAADDSGRVPVQAPTGTTRINSGHEVIRFRVDGSTADSVWYPSAPEPAIWRVKNAHADMGMLVPYAPDRITAFDRAGRLIWGDQATYRLLYSRTGSDTLRIVEAPMTPIPIADSLRRNEFNNNVTKHTWLQGVAKLDDIPRNYPAWTGLVADGANNLWVLRPGSRGDGDHWDVFDPDGRLLGAVPAPFNHVDDTFWTRDRVYVLQDGADGTPAILVYRIDKGAH